MGGMKLTMSKVKSKKIKRKGTTIYKNMMQTEIES